MENLDSDESHVRRAPYPILLLSAVAFWLRAEDVVGGSSAALLAAMLCLIALVITTALAGAHRMMPGWKWLITLPLAVAALTWFALFLLRPIELFFYPSETITPLIQLGTTPAI